MESNPALHHIGYVVDSISERIDSFRASVAATGVSEIFHDPIQKSRVIFLKLPAPSPLLLELVEPAAPDSPVTRFLQKGGGLHHLCYEVDDLAQQISWMKSLRAILLRSPQPAVAFGGRRIAWVRTKDAMLIEYLERSLPA
jgi:methylmalonyl-CoA/ethylmalonyl-CoA epimerase